MGPPLCLGRPAEFWFGMPHARTRLPLPIPIWQPEKLAQSQLRLSRGNELSTQSWKQATILYLWPLRQQVSLAQRLCSSFVNLGTTSSWNLGRHNPFTSSNRGYRWLYRGQCCCGAGHYEVQQRLLILSQFFYYYYMYMCIQQTVCLSLFQIYNYMYTLLIKYNIVILIVLLLLLSRYNNNNK